MQPCYDFGQNAHHVHRACISGLFSIEGMNSLWGKTIVLFELNLNCSIQRLQLQDIEDIGLDWRESDIF